MKIVYLATWKPDADPEAVATFLREVPAVLATGPFVTCAHGPGLKVSKPGTNQADWGFVVDLDPGDLEVWRNADGHRRLGELLRPISGGGISFEL